ncbi:MAG: mycolate reductase [Myxococcales bacterium]
MNPISFRGRWVLVTGASSGLGRAMAFLLAREHGANIVAVARRANLLDELKREIESGSAARVEPLVADMARPEDVERVLRTVTGDRPIHAAVLNAGVTHFGHYDALSWPDFETMLHVNVTSTVRLTTGLLPFLERGGEGGGLLLVASMAGMMPIPYQAAYSATKAFLVHFGCGLWHELRGRNVSITTYAPGGIATEMTAGESFEPLRRWLMPVVPAAREGIEAFRTRKYLHVPGRANRIGSALLRLLPRRMVGSRVGAVYRRALEVSRKRLVGPG